MPSNKELHAHNVAITIISAINRELENERYVDDRYKIDTKQLGRQFHGNSKVVIITNGGNLAEEGFKAFHFIDIIQYFKISDQHKEVQEPEN